MPNRVVYNHPIAEAIFGSWVIMLCAAGFLMLYLVLVVYIAYKKTKKEAIKTHHLQMFKVMTTILIAVLLLLGYWYFQGWLFIVLIVLIGLWLIGRILFK